MPLSAPLPAFVHVPLARLSRRIDRVVHAGSAPELSRQVDRVQTILRAFYAYVLFLAFPWSSQASAAWTSAEVPRPKLHLELTALFAPANWPFIQVLCCFLLLAGGLALILNPGLRWVRVLVAAGFVFFTAMAFDEKGKIDHGNHAAMWTAIGLCFLPGGQPKSELEERRLVTSFFGVQLLVGMLYTCAGICKLIGTFYDFEGGVVWFHPDALPLMLSGNWDRSRETLLAGFLVLHPGLTVLAQTSAVVLELGALGAVCFRHLQRPWALGLMTMHALILHSMKIHFHQSCIILALVLVASPFATPLGESVRFALERLRPSRERSSAGKTQKAPGVRADPGALCRLWGPALVAVYLLVAFGRFEPSRGAFRQELYPFSPLAMFFRLHPSEQGLRSLEKLRAKLEQEGLFSEREKARRKAAKREKKGRE